MAVVENEGIPYTNTTASGLTDENMNSALRKKQLLNLAAWNVRATNDSVNSISPERATAIICRALEEADIDICTLYK